ncbi:MAG: O-methyltransferase [Gemmatimonadaceae bacterium]|nr:O-methyltransferase [Chitinophagaceae bacterium]
MEILSPAAEAYADRFTSPLDALLQKVADYTYANHPHSHMLSGKVQGKFLSLISTLLKPRRILEIGTFTGFSALCLAEGLDKNGVLHTIELREEDAGTARNFFKESINFERIILHTGNALEIIPTLKEEWDLVFIDADKTGYLEYYKLILPKLKKGGLILADNVLFHGEVFQDTISGKNGKAIQAFNEYIYRDQSVEKVLLTVRDGLMFIVKK